jgi:hypothetical protein
MNITYFSSILRRPWLYLILGWLLTGCSWLTRGKPERIPAQTSAASPAAPVAIISSGLLRSDTGKPELGLTLFNASDRVLWVSAHFKTPGGQADCVLSKEMEGQARRLYLCSQAGVRAGVDYPIQVTVYADLEQTQPLDGLDTVLRFTDADIQVLKTMQ